MSDYTRKMLTEIRKKAGKLESVELPDKQMVVEQENICGSILTESDDDNKENAIVISSKDVQFGGVRSSQEDAIKKTIGDVTLEPDALKYYPEIHDLVFNGEVNGIGVTFQFRYKDPSGDGCYVWAEGLQMTDSNLRTIEKIRDAFLNWKQSLVEDGDLLEKLDNKAKND